VRRLPMLLSFLPALFPVCLAADTSTPEEIFKKNYPDKNMESFTPTPIKGVYEVYTGNQLFYYAPEANLLIYGNIVTREGISLTQESLLKKLAPKMAKLPLENALKIGNGKNIIVEIIDPDCFHCRESYKFFSRRKDVTIYAFFYPLSQDSEKKIRHILCSSDTIKAYHDAMSGALDNNTKLNVCNDKKVEETIKFYKKQAAQIGIRAAPIFYVKGQVIPGFQAPVFEQILKN